MIDVNQLMELMETKGIARANELVGVSTSERQALEQFFDLEFPQAYRDYLHHFGRSAGFLSPWMAIYFDDLKEIRESFDREAKSVVTPVTLPPRALLISHWENVFDYILCDGEQDPAVFRVDLSQPQNIRHHAPSFSKYIEELIRNAGDFSVVEDITMDEQLLPAEDIIRY